MVQKLQLVQNSAAILPIGSDNLNALQQVLLHALASDIFLGLIQSVGFNL